MPEWTCGECGAPVYVKQGPKAKWYQCPRCGTRVYLGKDLDSVKKEASEKDE